jgi:hypothetical protein
MGRVGTGLKTFVGNFTGFTEGPSSQSRNVFLFIAGVCISRRRPGEWQGLRALYSDRHASTFSLAGQN